MKKSASTLAEKFELVDSIERLNELEDAIFATIDKTNTESEIIEAFESYHGVILDGKALEHFISYYTNEQ